MASRSSSLILCALFATSCVSAEPELIESLAEATPVPTDGTPIAGTIPGNGWRVHTFTVTAAGDIAAVLDWTRTSSNLNLFLYDPSGALVGSANGTSTRPEQIDHADAGAGTWSLGIKNKSSQSTAYSLSVTVSRAGVATVFGESLGGHGTLAQSIQYALDRFGEIPVARMYYGEGRRLPASWNDPMLQALPDATHVILSFKPTGYGSSPAVGLANIASGAADADIRSLLSSRPAGIRVWLSLFHEPENDFEEGDFTSAQYKAAWRRVGQVVRSLDDPEARSALILMRYTLNAGSGRDWHDFYTADGPDVFAWDAYNFANNPSPSRYQSADEILGPIIAVADQTGKPWGIGEFGSALAAGDTGGSGRAAWLTAVGNRAIADGRAEFFAYWDRQSLYTETDYTLTDQRSIDAWRTLCAR